MVLMFETFLSFFPMRYFVVNWHTKKVSSGYKEMAVKMVVTVLVILNISLVGCVPLKNSFPGIWRYTKYWAVLAGIGK